MICRHAQPKRGLLAVAWIAFVVTAHCLAAQVAGLEIKMKTEGDLWFGEAGTFSEPLTYRMIAEHASLEWRNQLDVIDTDQRKFYAVDLLARTYREFGLPVDLMAALPDPRFRPATGRILDRYDPPITVQRSQVTELIAGYEVTRVDVRIGGPNEAVQGTFHMWVSADLEQRLAAYPYRQLERSRFASTPFAARWLTRILDSQGGVPVQVDADFQIDGRRTKYRRTLVSIRETELGNTDFALPEGLERVEALTFAKPQPLPSNGG